MTLQSKNLRKPRHARWTPQETHGSEERKGEETCGKENFRTKTARGLPEPKPAKEVTKPSEVQEAPKQTKKEEEPPPESAGSTGTSESGSDYVGTLVEG